MFFNKYPYSDFHELNLDWIINKIREVEKLVNDFVAFEKITWAGEWDASKSYVKWSIVQDGNGDGYLSINPVPVNVPLNNTNYWIQIAKYSDLYAAFESRIATLEENKHTIVGRTVALYVDGTNGDDTNDGSSTVTAFKTLEPVWKAFNNGINSVILVYLMGNDVYNVGTEIRSIAGNVPHIKSYNGSPTLKFNPTVGTAGPCFYNTHINIGGIDAAHPLIIDSTYGGFYAEGCAVSLGYAQVKCSFYIVGGSGHIYNTEFTNESAHIYGGHAASLNASSTNLWITNCTFNSDASSNGMFIGLGSHARIYGDNIFNGDGQNMRFDGATISLSGNVTDNNTSANAFMRANYSKVIMPDTAFFKSIAIDNYYSDIQLGRSYTHTLGCAPGESISLNNFNAQGYIKNTGDLSVTIPLPRIMNNDVTDMSITATNIAVYGSSGNLIAANDFSTIVDSQTVNYNSYVFDATLVLDASYKISGHDNETCTVRFTGLKIEAS